MFVVRTGGGGGWGDPRSRDPELVRAEAAAGLLTVEQARDWFGVVLTGTPLRVDAAATDALREVMPDRSEPIDRGTPQRTPGPDEYLAAGRPACALAQARLKRGGKVADAGGDDHG